MNKTRLLIITALFTALICVATMVSFPVAFTNGYIHLGDGIIFLAVILLPMPYGIFAAGVGSMLADITLGYTHWALPTLIIKSLMAILLHIVYHRAREPKKAIGATVTLGSIWVIFSVVITGVLTGLTVETQSSLVSTVDGISSIEALMSFAGLTKIAVLGFAILLPITLGILIAVLHKKMNSKIAYNQVLGICFSGLWMIIGYYFAAGIMKGNFIIPIFSVPTNIIQFLLGVLISTLLIPIVKPLYVKVVN